MTPHSLDEQIAIEVYGFVIETGSSGASIPLDMRKPVGQRYCENLPRYSSDLVLAIGVLEYLKDIQRVMYWQVGSTFNGYHTLKIVFPGHETLVEDYHCPIPEAICRHVVMALACDFGDK